MTKVTAHFRVEEWDRPARRGLPAAPYPREWIETRLRPLCELLEDLRGVLGGKPIRVISGYRDPEYNRLIGGAKASQHMEGRAADLVVAGVGAAAVHAALLALHAQGRRVPGLGLYPGFTHVDVRTGATARWSGSRTARATEGG